MKSFGNKEKLFVVPIASADECDFYNFKLVPKKQFLELPVGVFVPGNLRNAWIDFDEAFNGR